MNTPIKYTARVGEPHGKNVSVTTLGKGRKHHALGLVMGALSSREGGHTVPIVRMN